MPSAHPKALETYRTRQAQRGIAPFEIQAPVADRALIRALARRLAEGTPDAARTRATLERLVTGDPPASGGILAALRRSPLVGADLDRHRPREDARTPAL